ncbi:hypothetical protein CEE37_00070 [candidate division LCP-89 bacterium B3_LCP]|uniref:VCBS repeat-containing protein n=1 Tax=candidate division LCP-89 bacterium B3_LCP TaxID=2012998 RepID=A0A532V4N5_UNCL8|nr:MAG: hypothetical protein CEE37_00070 [candidate division LCP-89 bacterium B3_LCP]
MADLRTLGGGYTHSHPDLCNIDSDNDLDFFVGSSSHYVDYYENTGTATDPEFVFGANNWESVCCFPNNSHTNPDFWDLDDDGDKDLLIGAGYVRYYQNVGTQNDPDFTGFSDTLFEASGNWVFGTHVALVDLDDDDDGDLICGEYQGHLQFYRNIGTPDSFSFYLEDANWIGVNVGDNADPTFCDLDNDSDFDLFIGDENGSIWYFLNDGDSITYNFIYQTDHFANIDVGDHASPEFADIDGDGDYDLFVGSEDTGPFYYENIGTPFTPNFSPVIENYLTIDLGYWQTRSQIVDINGDEAPDLIAATTDHLFYFENSGTGGNPHFILTAEAWQGIYQPAIKPYFVDIDADGDYDLFCGEGVIPGPPSVALYINRGTPQEPDFVLHDPNYITNEDFFVNTSPGLTDIDADGDYDMFISDGGGNFFYYQNIGDLLSPNFTCVDSQWQGIQFLYPRDGWRGFDFVDIDDDQDYDLFIESHVDYNLCFYRNTGTPQNANMVLEIDVLFPDISLEPCPTFVDIDLDGDEDLFCGETGGGIFFFRNVTGQNEVGPKRPDTPFPKLDFSIGPNPANPITWISFTLPSP